MIVVCGEALIDVIRNPDGTSRSAPGGGPFNTARALGRLGAPTAFLGHLSTDEPGRRLASLLTEDSVRLDFASFGPEPTTTAIAEVDSAGRAEYRFVVEGTSVPSLTAEMLPQEFGAELEGLYFGGLGLALEPIGSTVTELVAREHPKSFLMIDPNIRGGLGPEDRYRERLLQAIGLSTLVKASDADLAWLYPGLSCEDASRAVLELGPQAVVVTLGANGAFAVHGGKEVRVAAPRVEVVDTIGAGDAFGAALVTWLRDHDRLAPELTLTEDELKAALELACRAAAITCTRAGADSPTRQELTQRSAVDDGGLRLGGPPAPDSQGQEGQTEQDRSGGRGSRHRAE